MNKLAKISVGNGNPIRIMGILNTSPESFYKNSICISKNQISNLAKKMENDGADFIDVGGMSTAPYLSTSISEKLETKRIVNAIKIIQNSTNLPISVDTCRSTVAENALELGVEIINDVSGLKYDQKMIDVIRKYHPSLILCAHSKKITSKNHLIKTKQLLKDSIKIAKSGGVSTKNIIVDPAVGFFRRGGKGFPFTKIDFDWFRRDKEILENLNFFKFGQPCIVSISNKSIIGRILDESDLSKRLNGSLDLEMFSVINGVDLIRTHNVKQSREVVSIAKKIQCRRKGL